jgi:DNA polymerase I-like protein with 3'-5' exonuclease and polymerase domains
MEVYVLQWLSKDERLGKIISSGRDIYSTIYSLLYGRKCNKENRQLIKESFLPIVYGMQSESISDRLNINVSEAKELLKRINGFFSTAMDWVQDQQDKAKKSSVVCDYFERPRDYSDRSPLAVRNAVVQGPAAIVCMEKLISLFDKVFKQCEIVASIHDAYVLDIPCNLMYDVVYYATEVLQEPSVFMPGLKLTVDVNIGNDLENIVPFKI